MLERPSTRSRRGEITLRSKLIALAGPESDPPAPLLAARHSGDHGLAGRSCGVWSKWIALAGELGELIACDPIGLVHLVCRQIAAPDRLVGAVYRDVKHGGHALR